MNPSLLSRRAFPETALPVGHPAANTPAPPGGRQPLVSRPPAAWNLATVAGRLVEISGTGTGTALTLAARLLLDAQQQGEPTAWVTCRKSLFFPPDAADTGIDLAALAVVRATSPVEVAKAAEHLLRSGAFGMVVVDLGAAAAMPLHVQVRLAAQARQHTATLLCLTEKERSAPSLGSLISLRAHTSRIRREKNADGYFRPGR